MNHRAYVKNLNKLLKPKEKDLQKSFYHRVRTKQLYNLYPEEFYIFATCNEHLGGSKYIKHLSQMGLRAGFADVGFLFPKRLPAFLEFKRDEKHKQSPMQQEFEQMCLKFGFPYHLSWDIDEAEDWLVSLLQ